MSDVLNEFLAKESVAKRCCVCAIPEVAEIVAAHLDLLREGKTHITLRHMHRGLILPTYGAPKTIDSIHKHVRVCLKRDPQTGRAL